MSTRTVHALDILIPGVPSKALITSNGRHHWRVKAKRTAVLRELARIHAHNAIIRGDLPRLQRAHIRIVMTWKDNRVRDPANWYPTFKAMIDGFVDAGLLPADDYRHLDGPDMRGNPQAGPTSVRFEITDLGPALI